MKRLIFLLICLLTMVVVYAQADSLRQYTGKYKFSGDSPISEVNVVVENGILMIISSMGSSELRKEEGDVFIVVDYGGTVRFQRNAENKVNAIIIEVRGLLMEGNKSD